LGTVQYVGGSTAGSESLGVAIYDYTTNTQTAFNNFTATTTVQPSISSLFFQNAASTAFHGMEGSDPSFTQLSALANFAQIQFNYGNQIGVDAFIAMHESLGAALSTIAPWSTLNGTGAYANNLNADTAWVNHSYQAIFGVNPTPAQSQHFVAQVDYAHKFFD